MAAASRSRARNSASRGLVSTTNACFVSRSPTSGLEEKLQLSDDLESPIPGAVLEARRRDRFVQFRDPQGPSVDRACRIDLEPIVPRSELNDRCVGNRRRHAGDSVLKTSAKWRGRAPRGSCYV